MTRKVAGGTGAVAAPCADADAIAHKAPAMASSGAMRRSVAGKA